MNLKDISVADMYYRFDWLDHIDKMDKSVEEKLQEILPAIECPEEFLELFKEVVLLIEDALRKRYRKLKINARSFGSAATGLCLKNSDLDLCIEIDPPDNDQKYLKFIKSTLYRDLGQCFNRILLIRAKVPIIQCVHEVGFQLDISVNNPIAVHNSQLIKFYTSLDKSFYTLFMCVKLWMKRHELSGCNKFTSYAITMLCIFFLQQNQLLPSVSSLQSDCAPHLINGWNVSFSSATETKSIRDHSTFQLLVEFFKFYSQFDFAFYVISLYMGHPILKPLPDEMIRCTDEEYSKYDSTSYLCLQDPFIHNFNPCRNVNLTHLSDLQSWFEKAYEICQRVEEEAHLLKILFSPYGYQTKKRKRTGYGNTIVLWVGKLYKFGHTVEEARLQWMYDVLDALEKIFSLILLATVERQEAFSCEIRYRALIKKLRQEAEKKAVVSRNLVNAERAALVSGEIMKTSSRERDLAVPLTLQVKHSLMVEPTRLKLEFSVVNGDSISKQYYYDYILPTFHKSLAAWVEDYRLLDSTAEDREVKND